MEKTYENPNEKNGGDTIKKLAMIIFDGLGIDLVRQIKLKELNKLYMGRNSQVLTCSTYPHTMTSNIMIWSGQLKNLFWIWNKTGDWQDPASVYNRDTDSITKDNIEIIRYNEIDVDTWIWDVLQIHGYKVRAVQLPFVLPPFSFNAVEETEAWFPYDWPQNQQNMNDKERITMDSLKDITKGKLNFYCTSFPQPDKLLHGVGEGHLTNVEAKEGFFMLDKIAKKIDDYCNKHNITYCIFGDHGLNRPEGDNFGYVHEQKIAVVRHQKHSIIMSNFKGEIPGYTDEIYPWMLKFFDIKDTKLKQKEEENITLTDEDEKIVIERLKKLGYL